MSYNFFNELSLFSILIYLSIYPCVCGGWFSLSLSLSLSLFLSLSLWTHVIISRRQNSSYLRKSVVKRKKNSKNSYACFSFKINTNYHHSHTRAHAHTHTHTHAYTHTRTRTHIRTHTYAHTHTHTHTHTYRYVDIYECVYILMIFVCMHLSNANF